MKLRSRICALLFSLFYIGQGQCLEIILVTYNQQRELAEKIGTIIEKEGMPTKIITIEKKDEPCIRNTNTVIHLCVTDSGEMLLLNYQKKIVKDSLNTFKESSIL